MKNDINQRSEKRETEAQRSMWERFCWLGEMIGDGLHDEEPWISKEYNKLLKILCPKTEEEKKIFKEIRIKRNQNIDRQIVEKLKIDQCRCTGELKQSRSGSKVVFCTQCAARYRYKSTKKK